MQYFQGTFVLHIIAFGRIFAISLHQKLGSMKSGCGQIVEFHIWNSPFFAYNDEEEQGQSMGGMYVPKRSPWRYYPTCSYLFLNSHHPYLYSYCWLKSDREVCVSLQKNRRHFFLYEKHYCQSQRVWCWRMFFNCSHGHIWPSLPSKPAALGT